MKLTRLFGMIALACLAGSARAQSGAVTIHLNHPLWVVNQDHNAASDSDFVDVYGVGEDALHVNGFLDIGTAAYNRAQSNVQGSRSAATPTLLTGSASASVDEPGGYMVFFWNGAGNRNVVVNAVITPTAVLPAQQSINMSATSWMKLTCGNYGFPDQPWRKSTASVIAPYCTGKICSVWNRKVLTQDAPLNQTFSTAAFFYSQQGAASANCTLHVGDSAFANTDVFTDFTANLN